VALNNSYLLCVVLSSFVLNCSEKNNSKSVAASTPTEVEETSTNLLGDLNNDGVVDGDDATELASILAAGTFVESADINGDGGLSDLDTVALNEIIGRSSLRGDINLDGVINGADATAMVTILSERRSPVHADLAAAE